MKVQNLKYKHGTFTDLDFSDVCLEIKLRMWNEMQLSFLKINIINIIRHVKRISGYQYDMRYIFAKWKIAGIFCPFSFLTLITQSGILILFPLGDLCEFAQGMLKLVKQENHVFLFSTFTCPTHVHTYTQSKKKNTLWKELGVIIWGERINKIYLFPHLPSLFHQQDFLQ